jgi:hypothetical protein
LASLFFADRTTSVAITATEVAKKAAAENGKTLANVNWHLPAFLFGG